MWVVDMGGGRMDMGVYRGGGLGESKVIGYGGNVVRSDMG